MPGEKTQKYLIRELGGLNQGTDPSAIGDNEFERLENMYPRYKRLIRRNGYTKLTTAGPWDEQINSFFAYKTGAAVWKLLVGGSTKLGYMLNNDVTDIAPIGNAFIAGTMLTNRFRWAQYKDAAYLCRKIAGTLYRTNGLTVGIAGIAEPTAACVIADGPAGDLGAGDYISVVTFYNVESGAESNPSPESNTLTLGASNNINYTSIPVSTNPQVNARRIYRTLANQTGEYYLVATITDNIQTTLTEDVLQNDMGDAASFDNGLPPTTCAHLTIWNERMWVTDTVDLFFSEFGLPESYSEFSVISVRPDDGHTINGLLAFGDALIIGKTNATYLVSGTDEADFSLSTLSDKFGCRSHDSMATAEGLAFWFGGDNYYMTDGNNVKAIGDSEIRDLIDGILATDFPNITGAIVDSLGWYVSGIVSDTVTYYLVYNYRENTWTTLKYNSTNESPLVIGNFFDEAGAAIVYASLVGTGASYLGHIYEWNAGTTDDGTAIAVDLLTKRYGLDRDDILKVVRDVALHTEKIADNITADVHVDGTSRQSKAINLYTDNPWKGISVSSVGYPGVYVQLRIRYTGTAAFDLKGFQLKVIDLNRRANKARNI